MVVNKPSGWFRRSKGTPHDRKKQPNSLEDPTIIPVLPSKRAFMLTPSPSYECIMASTATSSFFQRIPSEVRRMILTEAFGDRTVHLDFSFDHPMVYLSDEEAQKQRSHCGIDPGQARRPKRDTTRPKAWRWFSCVCHRDTESRVPGIGSSSEPYTDICLGGTAGSCRGWRGKFPYKCFIGVMGWLLTCRQA